MIQPIQIKTNFPETIQFHNFIAKKLTPKCLFEDYSAVIENEVLIKTRGGSWPDLNSLNLQEDMIDLSWHQREFENESSFAFVIFSNQNKYIGCVYLYPMNFRTDLGEKNSEYCLDFSFWTTQEFYDNGTYKEIYKCFSEKLVELGYSNFYCSNIEK